VGLVVLLVAAVAWGVVAWRRGEQWHDRADSRGELLDELESEMTTANEEITALEGRLDELASEKAGTEDEREAAVITADQLEELVRQAGLVATDLDTCARGAVDVVNLVNSLGEYDVEQVNTYVVDVQDVCGRALAGNDALQQAIESLDQPPADPGDG
jgi:cell division septum initiation protein DivIVA